jgi:2-isopropylmalate synthase
VLDYHEDAVTAGADAQAAAYVQIHDETAGGSGGTLYGVGMDSDIVTASLKAVASAASRAAPRAAGK